MTTFESTRSSGAERVNVASATDGCEVDFGEVPGPGTSDLGDVSTGLVCEASDSDSAGTSGAEGWNRVSRVGHSIEFRQSRCLSAIPPSRFSRE